MPKAIAFAGSTRTASFNAALTSAIVTALGESGLDAEHIDLNDYEMPLVSEDYEAANGVPEAAARLIEKVREADAVVMVTPEYNGSFTPLLKNTIDWMSRIDDRFLSEKVVALASASPGPGGGARAVAMVRIWMQNMGIEPLDAEAVAGAAYEVFGEQGSIIRDDVNEALSAFVKKLFEAVQSV